MMNTFTYTFIGFLLATVGTQLWLAQRQGLRVMAHRKQVPDPFNDKISLQAHQKAADYTLAKVQLEKIDVIFSALILLCWTLGGGLYGLDTIWRSLEYSPIITGIAVLMSVLLISNILELPLSIYQTFVVEERFGFNKTTASLFVKDMIKQMILAFLIGVPLIWLVLWLMEQSGSLWWLYVWMVWIGFSLLMMWAYPAFISPLFNKFSPLSDNELKTRIENLLKRTGFTSNGIFIMDGSRRSGHGNAYFTGLGTNKRIVFFDTLIDTLSPDEIEAVLAHELGHFKRHHVHKRFITMSGLSLVGLALLGWLINQTWFYHGLGVQHSSHYIALILFMFVIPVFSFFISPIMTRLSRKHEFEADDFAAEQADPRELIRALVKLYVDNAATLTPDPLYSAFYDSHPPAPERVAHLSTKF